MERSDRVARLREWARKAVSERRIGKPYPEDFRNAVMAFARKRISQGANLSTAASELSMSYWTVWGWFRPPQRKRTRKRPTQEAPQIVPVRIAETRGRATTTSICALRPIATMTVHGPRGLRVDGVDVETLAELMRRLG